MTCLDADTVLAFLDGQLPAARAAEIEEHLDTCAACRRMVSEAAADGVAAGDDLRGVPARVGWYDVSEPLPGPDSRERYRAYDPRRAREVCLELFRGEDGPMSPDEADRTEKALRPAAGVAHPNLIAVLDVGTHDGAVYVVTELVEGDSLATVLARRTPIELEQALGWLRGIARGLAAAHDRGLAHGRLTPADVIVQRSDERARVADVAVARLAGTTSSPPYRAPELMDPGSAPRRNDDVVRRDARVDVYAWGVLAHALAGGDPEVFERLTDRSVLGAKEHPRAKGASPRPAERSRPPEDEAGRSGRSPRDSDAREQLGLSEGVPDAFAHVIRRALWRAPAARFANARELAFVLETLDLATATARPDLGGASTVPEAMPASARVAPARPRAPSVRLWLAASLLVVGAAALAWVFLRRGAASTASPPAPAVREPPTISRLLARSGHVIAARQAPNGLYVSIVLGEGYGASGFGGAAIHKRTLDGLEEIPRTAGAVLAAAGKDRIAVLRDPWFDGELTHGTVELIDPTGATQELDGDRTDIVAAELTGDGLAVVRLRAEVARVEAPLGTVVYQAPSRVWSLRANPRGRLAWVERANGRVRIATLVRGEAPVVLADDGLWRTVVMVAWHGERLLVAGSRGAVEHGLWMIDAANRPQLVWTSPQLFALFDVTAERELVVGLYDYANHIWAHPAGAARDREVAWSDRSLLAGVSLDGRFLAMMEAPVNFGDPGTIHVRALDGVETIPVGRGHGGPLSGDARWIFTRSATTPWHPVVTALASTPWDRDGEKREVRHLPAGDITEYQRVSWYGERVVLLARGARGDAVYTQGLDGPPQRVGPWTGHPQRGPFLASPDGKYIADFDRDGTPALFELATLAMTRLPQRGIIVGWSTDAREVFVSELRWPLVVTRVPIAKPAEAEPLLAIEAPGPGLMPPADLRIAGDGRTYVYSAQTLRSTLYRVQGALPDDQAP